MPRLFVANLHFEQQIAGDRQDLPLALRQRAAEQACGWLAVAQPADLIWCPRPVKSEFWESMSQFGLPMATGVSEMADVPHGLELTPWGWSSAAERFGQTVKAHCQRPPMDAIRRANSRRFSFEFESKWNVGLEGAVGITSAKDLERALSGLSADQRWVLKAEFGAAARQRIVCTGPAPDATAAGWIRKRLAAGEWLAFEPWVERICEAGLQWTVPRGGVPVFEGVTELLNDDSGQYRGSRFGLEPARIEAWQPAIDVAQRAVGEIQQSGYFGPVGVDAMRYRDVDRVERIRPLQDINARWTMGRLALGWRRVMPSGVWRHGSVEEFEARLKSNPAMIRTSPQTIGNARAQTATWLEPAP